MMGAMQGSAAIPAGGSSASSTRIVQFDLIGTAVFVGSASMSAVLFTGALRVVAVIVALFLFAVGVASFLWGYWTAVQRSRTHDIAVVQLYFLVGASAPRGVKRRMNLALVAQMVVGLATAIGRSTTDGRAGSTLAFGILVPMFGLGLNGLWCSKFGTFSARNVPSVPTSHDEMEQNSTHG